MSTDRIIIISCFIVMAVQMLGFGIYLRRNKLSISGVFPVNKQLFKITKAVMMLVWLVLFIQAAGINLSFFNRPFFLTVISIILLITGTAIQFLSYIYLGKNLKFGIPDDDEASGAVLKTKGLYRFSRNPMYTGFYLIMLSAPLYVMNPVIWTLSIFSICIHHRIILKEEMFLGERFGAEWIEYCSRVRRYI
jgi:protein-S-isoprenylcysteine O-methyltransferase Ste14